MHGVMLCYGSITESDMTPTQGKEYQELRQKLKMIICHASGGYLHKASDIDRSINDICVQISAHRNEVYAQGKEIGFKAGFNKSRTFKENDADKAFEEWKGTWT